MAKVLVTGATGFIGEHLVAALAARGDAITCLVRNSSHTDSLLAQRARLVLGDVTDGKGLSAAVAGQQVVYHLAGCTRALKSRQFYEVNAQGVTHIARACAEQETPPILVSVSSLAAAGPAIGERPRVESDPPEPVSDYGRSKRSGEQAAESFAAPRVPVKPVPAAALMFEAA